MRTGKFATAGSTPAVQYTKWQNAPGGGSEGDSYDANGNKQTAGQTNNGIGTDNQVSNDGLWQYTYANNGNLISQTSDTGDTVINYTYDYRNRLTGSQYE